MCGPTKGPASLGPNTTFTTSDPSIQALPQDLGSFSGLLLKAALLPMASLFPTSFQAGFPASSRPWFRVSQQAKPTDLIFTISLREHRLW